MKEKQPSQVEPSLAPYSSRPNADERYRLLFDTIDQGVTFCRLVRNDQGAAIDLIILQVNPAWEKIMGIKPETVVGRRCTEWLPHLEQEWLSLHERVIDTGQSERSEYRASDLNRWFEIFVSSCGDGCTMSVFNDTTERNQARQQLLTFNQTLKQQLTEHTQALEETQSLLQAAVNISTMGMVVAKSIRNSAGAIIDFEYTWLNPAGLRLAGQDIKGKAMLQTYPHVKVIGLFDAYVNTVENSMPTIFEEYFQPKNCWFRWQAAKLNDGLFICVEEITERKIAEKELKDNRDLLQSIYNTTLIGMAVHEAVRNEDGLITDFRIKAVNAVIERLTGKNNLVGKLYSLEFPGIKRMGLFNLMVQVLETGTPKQIEYSYPYDGFDKHFLSMFVKLNDGIVATNIDITELRLAEEERFKSFMLLQQSEDLAAIGSWKYDLLTRQFEWSDGMYRLFNLDKELQMQPEVYLRYVTPNSRPVAEQVVNYIKNGGQDFEETLEITVDGEIKFIRLKAKVIYDEEHRPVGVLGADLDITATQQAEQQLLENAAMIQGIADAVPDMVYVINIRTMQKVYANYRIVQLLQKTPQQMKAMGSALFDTFVHPDDRRQFRASIEDMRNSIGDKVKELTYRLIDYKGNIHWMKSRGTVYKRDEAGRPTHILGVSQDITEQRELQENNRQLQAERKQLEEQRQQEILRTTLNAQEEERKRIAESLHNGIGQILYGVKLSLGQLSLNRPDKLEDNMETLKQTDNLLNEAIKESRRISHELTPTILEDFGLKAAIADVCHQLKLHGSFTYEFKGLSQKLDKYLEIAVYRIVQELMLNVVKHAGTTEGYLQIELKKNRISIKVQDNGKGFDTSKVKSHGIGLKTVQSRVKLLKGEMQIVSVPDKGTEITIGIPIHSIVKLKPS